MTRETTMRLLATLTALIVTGLTAFAEPGDRGVGGAVLTAARDALGLSPTVASLLMALALLAWLHAGRAARR